MTQYLVAIILPMYNEERSIQPLRSMFEHGPFLPTGCDYRLFAVNDGSSDGTLSLLNKWKQENGRLSVLSHVSNQGLGQAILTGFGAALKHGANCIVTLDADATHPPEMIKRLVEAVLAGSDIAIASRFAREGGQTGVPTERRLFSWGARLVLGAVFPLQGVRDYTIGFRAYRAFLVRKALATKDEPLLALKTFAATAELLLKLSTLAQKITEVPLVLRYDLKRSPSKLRLLATLRDYARLCCLPKTQGALGIGLRLERQERRADDRRGFGIGVVPGRKHKPQG